MIVFSPLLFPFPTIIRRCLVAVLRIYLLRYVILLPAVAESPSDLKLQVPADMVVNATLAAIAKHGSAGKPESNVYQIASSVVNPLVFRDLASLLHQHFESAPCVDPKGRPVRVPTMKLFGSMEDFSSHLWRDAIERTGLNSTASNVPNGTKSKKLENICRKIVEQAKYLASIYQPYTFYGGR